MIGFIQRVYDIKNKSPDKFVRRLVLYWILLSADIVRTDRLVIEYASDSLGKTMCYRKLLHLWTTLAIRDTVREYDFCHL